MLIILAMAVGCLAMAVGCGDPKGKGDALDGQVDIRFSEGRIADSPLDVATDSAAGDAAADAGPGDTAVDSFPHGIDADSAPGDTAADAGPGDSAPADGPTGDPQDLADPCHDPGGFPLTCDDGIACTADTCVPGVGCSNTPADGACDDGIPCTADTCVPGVGCSNTPADGACDDGIACTADTCVLGVGCSNTPADGACDDGIPCTADTCVPGVGCSNTPADGACDDGIPCTADTCVLGVGCSNTPANGACDDGIPCTADTCVLGVGCSNTPDDGACDDGNICSQNKCEAGSGCVAAGTEPGPCQWPGNWFLSAQNPVLVPTPTDPDQGADNVYAPDVLFHDGKWWMWYGGQGSDGHDSIFVAWSSDLVSWSKHASAGNPVPVVDHGGANHVNDPSVVHVGGTFYMYYTEAPTGENDRIYLATSADGISWTKKGMVLDVGAPGSWEPDRVGRPSVLYEDGQFRMWYDGQIYGVARHVGYATSPDGYNWTKHSGNPVLLHQGAVDVDRVGDWYVLLSESGNGTLLFVAKNPAEWTSLGQLFGKSGQGYDAYGQVTPFLLVDGGAAKAILFGGASHSCWCKNRIALALPDGSPDIEGCNGCLVGYSDCDSACAAAGNSGGWCAAPGSQDPSACCACF
jgi:sucrose-6-phosphate hydrolase SacC (GH32 family)